MSAPRPNSDRARLLSVIGSEPLTLREIVAHADARYGVLSCSDHAARASMLALTQRGLVVVAVRGGPGGHIKRPHKYIRA